MLLQYTAVVWKLYIIHYMLTTIPHHGWERLIVETTEGPYSLTRSTISNVAFKGVPLSIKWEPSCVRSQQILSSSFPEPPSQLLSHTQSLCNGEYGGDADTSNQTTFFQWAYTHDSVLYVIVCVLYGSWCVFCVSELIVGHDGKLQFHLVVTIYIYI